MAGNGYTTPWQNDQKKYATCECSIKCCPFWRPSMILSVWSNRQSIDPESLQRRYTENRQRRNKKREREEKEKNDQENGGLAIEDGEIDIVILNHIVCTEEQ